MKQVIRDRVSTFQNKKVPDGYKKLYNGILPNDWNVSELSDIKDPVDNYSFTGGPFGSNLKSEHYTDDGIRIIQLQNIGDGRFLNEYKIYTSFEKANELINCNIYPGEIIIAKMAEPLARACIMPSFSDRYLMASDGIRLKIDNSKCITKFVLECINSDYFRIEAIKRGTGTTRLRIGLNVLGSIEIPVPSLMEQQRIADILSTWDKAIELKERLIEEKMKQKSGLMQKLLTGKVRLPGFDGEWEEIALKKCIIEYTEKSVEPNQYPVLTSSRSGLMLQSDYYSNRQVTTDDNVGYNIIPRGYITFRSRSDDGKFVFNKNTIIDFGIVSYFYPVFKFNDKVDGDFMLELLNYSIKRQSNSFVEGTAQKVLSLKKLGSFKYVIPPKIEQEAISKILNLANDEIVLMEKELDALKLQKKGLMQLLLTGIVRVNTEKN